MADFDPNSAECFVLTFKDGLLSPVAHDLKIKVGKFAMSIDQSKVEGRWDARSLVVDTVMRDGHEARGVLGQRDMDKIAKTIREDVLSADRHAEITFRSESVVVAGELAKIRGALTLVGRTQTIAIEARREGARWVAEVVLHQPDFGIKPYTAMLGTLKIKPDVRVRVAIPAERLGA